MPYDLLLLFSILYIFILKSVINTLQINLEYDYLEL